MSVEACANRFPHITLERNWAPTSDEVQRIWVDFQAPDPAVGDMPDYVSAVNKLNANTLTRHLDSQKENFRRLPFRGTEKHDLNVLAGKRDMLGRAAAIFAIAATRGFERHSGPQDYKVTLELVGKVIYGVRRHEEVDATPRLLQQQLAAEGTMFYHDLSPHRKQKTFKFFPFFRNPNAENPDFSFNDGWIRMRQPIANLVSDDYAPLNVFRQQDIMLYLPRTDQDTRDQLRHLSDQQWGQEGQYKSSEVSRITARNAYERFVGNPQNPLRDMLVLRDQILIATA